MLRSKARVTGSAFVVLFICIVSSHPRCFAQKDNPDYSLGQPRVWIYQRVYPFLDGIFQDVASTQVAPLVLNANSANASQLNALQTSLGVGVTYSATAQAQNALAQQQTQLMGANTQLQSQLLTQQAQITQQLLTATQQQGQAQAALAQLSAQSSSDAMQQAAAQAALSAANSNVTSLTNQLSLVKAQMPPSSPTFSAPSASQPSSATLPSQLSGSTAPPGAPTSPNFPSSKQMDNQVNLLWERLSRLVSTLAQADSLRDYQFLLAGFSVNLMPSRENKKLFAVEYKATTSGCQEAPLVVELFPSASAVNIVNNQYRSSSEGFSAVLSWFGIGVNAAYNREHLRMTQALGQSAYITGYGAGREKFGWAFGRNLGDNSISPGERIVFAIIAVPSMCDSVTIRSTRAGWFGEKSDSWYSKNETVKRNFAIEHPVTLTQQMNDKQDTAPWVKSVDFTPIEFDPTSATPAISALRIDLDTPVDPELEISVNGQVIPRARDTFARAVQNFGGSGGMLESTSFSANTWIATSSETITMSLDPSKFSRNFPDIVFLSPSSVRPLNESVLLPELNDHGQLVPGKVLYMVGGQNLGCIEPCQADIPPLGFRKATWQTLSAFEVEDTGAKNPRVVLSLPSDVSIVSPSAAASGSVQVLTAARSPWGGNVVVTASIQCDDKSTTNDDSCPTDSKNKQSASPDAGYYDTSPAVPQSAEESVTELQAGQGLQLIRLFCHPVSGSVRLVCNFPLLANYFIRPVTIEVHDADHAGVPVSARVTLEPPDSQHFIVWSVSQPRWVTSNEKGTKPVFVLCTVIKKAADGDQFVLGYANGTPLTKKEFKFNENEQDCPKDPTFGSEGVELPADDYVNLTDQMTIVRENAEGAVMSNPATLLNLHAAGEPLVNAVSSDYLQMYGQNFVFGSQLRIGGGNPVPISCDPAGSSCQVIPSPAAGKTKPAAAAAKTPTPKNAAAKQTPTADAAKTSAPKSGAGKQTPARASLPKNPLGSNGGPIYMVYTDPHKHAFIIPVMKNTSGTIAPFQYAPPGGPNGGAGSGGGGQMSFGMTISAGSNGSGSQPAASPTPASSGTSGAPTTSIPSPQPATNPSGVSPMSIIVVQ